LKKILFFSLGDLRPSIREPTMTPAMPPTSALPRAYLAVCSQGALMNFVGSDAETNLRDFVDGRADRRQLLPLAFEKGESLVQSVKEKHLAAVIGDDLLGRIESHRTKSPDGDRQGLELGLIFG
jgi:hypothetical protein